MKVLLIHAPLTKPHMPSLGIEKVAQVLRSGGVSARVFYASLLLPRSLSRFFEDPVGEALFTPLYFSVEMGTVARSLVSEGPSHCQENESDWLDAMGAAQIWFERSMEWIASIDFDVVGFSISFDSQRMPSLALSRGIKRGRDVPVIFGGTACDGDMGDETLRSFSEIDYVCKGEAEARVVELVRAAGERRPCVLPGVLSRLSGAVPTRGGSEEEKTTVAYSHGFLDVTPRYDDFLNQRNVSEYSSEPLVLLFEFSRGCWWGVKRRCRFCGIRNVEGPYRTASNETALAVYEDLLEYRPDVLYATDAILDPRMFDSVLPTFGKLCLTRGAPTLFFEVKPTLCRRQMAVLAAAGARAIQPGIESFSEQTLRRFNKGGGVLLNIRTLRNASVYAVHPIYGLLFGAPGERIEEVEETIEVIRKIMHLPPPSGAYRVVLHDSSPYQRDLSGFGIRRVMPFWYQKIVYQTRDEDVLGRLCYAQDFDALAEEGLKEAWERLRLAVESWRIKYEAGERLLLLRKGPMSARLLRYSCGEVVTSDDVSMPELTCLDALEGPASLRRVSERLGAGLFDVTRAVDRLTQMGAVIELGGVYLSVVQELFRDPWSDAEITSDVLGGSSTRLNVI